MVTPAYKPLVIPGEFELKNVYIPLHIDGGTVTVIAPAVFEVMIQSKPIFKVVDRWVRDLVTNVYGGPSVDGVYPDTDVELIVSKEVFAALLVDYSEIFGASDYYMQAKLTLRLRWRGVSIKPSPMIDGVWV